MNINFSIIIPIHKPNYEYLVECINSINHQLQDNDEVVCVLNGNDVNENKKIKGNLPKNCTVIEIDKGNVSLARNEGIKATKNNYLLFVDCDDIVGLSLLDKARKIINNNNPDYISFLDTTKQKQLNEDYKNCQSFSKDMFLNVWQDKGNNLLPSFQYRSCWNHIYKKDIILANDISFNANQTIAEDTLFNLEYTLNANSFVIDYSVMYFYRQNNNGSSITFNPYAINTIDVVVSNYINLLDKYKVGEPYYTHLYNEIVFNYFPYIFRSYLFHINNQLSTKEISLLIKKYCKNVIVSEAIKGTSLKSIKNKTHKLFLLMLKCRQYRLICFLQKKRLSRNQ